MPPHRDNSSSVEPQLGNTPCPLPPLPLASDQIVDDISDIFDSDSDDDLSRVLDAVTVSSINSVLSCILDIVHFKCLSIPHYDRLFQFPKALPTSKFSGYKLKQNARLAIQKCELADADFREAVLKAKLCRVRAQHAKRVLAATSVYADNVD
jgi:hypothetical protein